MNETARLRYSWFAALVAAQPERAKSPTALEDALLRAIEKALFNPHHRLHQEIFRFYDVPEKVSGNPPRRGGRAL